MLWHHLSPLTEPGPERLAREESRERLGEQHPAGATPVQRGRGVEDLPLRLREWLAQGIDELDVESTLEAVSAIRKIFHFGRLKQVGEPGSRQKANTAYYVVT